MEPHAGEVRDPGAKPGPKAGPGDDLKSLPMPALQAKLESSPDGLSQAEAEKRLAQYGPNEIEEKKANVFLKFLTYFWGPIPWMIEAAVILSGVVRHWPDFFIILFLPGGQRHRRPEGQAGGQGQGETRWEVDRTCGA